ncbi:pheromone shutdown-related protein TraB [Syntrophus gentianae]|uniref:Pheromone shutdown-related protein TraB n=1 Tax=Syntrophus gentianae TaxID=43775 RepID=A0A1H7YD04_9BACT|nr:TraB/GumN family protein [Syntrophus gentianae]SEM43724.1 pheromone shutdown-related protein TraB [Syntrophus gentianae]
MIPETSLDTMQNKNVHHLFTGEKEIILVGTAHVSRESADLVERVISEENPDTVCIELCHARFDALKKKDQWQEMDIVKVIREKRTSLLLSQLLMMSFQKKIAEKFNISPGEEMLRAMALAEKLGTNIVLADREIRVTLLRTWRKMRFFSKVRLMSEMFLSLFMAEDINEEDIEKLKEHDVLDMTLRQFGKKMPDLKETLIDERDQYLAASIRSAAGSKVVAVVGAGHIPGIVRTIEENRKVDKEAISIIPPPGIGGHLFGWGFSLAIVGIFVAGFFNSGFSTSLAMILSWSSITAICAAVGAILLLAHPLTIAAAACSAPIATLHPLIATGWVAGLTEATIRKPKVKDFLSLKDDILSVRGFLRNKITRILLLIAVVNLTTSIGTFAAIPVMMKYF